MEKSVPFGDEREKLRAAVRKINDGLNPSQLKGATSLKGPVLLQAGAGAGKTRVLVHRVANLICAGVSPSKILMVTFTNKAAAELKERVVKTLAQLDGVDEDSALHVVEGTFHSICWQLLKDYKDHEILSQYGLNMDEMSIIDDKDTRSLLDDAIKAACEEIAEIAEIVEQDGLKRNFFEERLTRIRARGLSLADYRQEQVPLEQQAEHYMVTEVWARYERKCRVANGIDFDDVLVITSKLVVSDDNVSRELSERFCYIMLDEYQDTNRVQMSIMDAIAQWHQNICPVGDEKQSIYDFRGTDITIMMSFLRRYSGAKVYDMQDNYRSTTQIMRWANACAQCMPTKLNDGQMRAMSGVDGDPPLAVLFSDDKEEAKRVAASIQTNIVKQGISPKEIAVLYRNRPIKGELEKELLRRDIPYRIVNDRSFFQSAEVRDIVALIRFVFRPWDSMAGIRLLGSMSIGVGVKGAKQAMEREGLTVFEYLERESQKKLRKLKSTQKNTGFTVKAQRLQPFVEMCRLIREAHEYSDGPAYLRDALAKMWDVYLQKRVLGKTAEADSVSEAKITNVLFVLDRMHNGLAAGQSLDEVIDDFILMVEQSAEVGGEDENCVQLMTVHASKGLEFDSVFIIGMEKNVMDNVSREANPEAALEEARRLFYVAMTRAKKRLRISAAKKRFMYGEEVKSDVSQFVVEVLDVLGEELCDLAG